jgi:hypothetical protein
MHSMIVLKCHSVSLFTQTNIVVDGWKLLLSPINNLSRSSIALGICKSDKGERVPVEICPSAHLFVCRSGRWCCRWVQRDVPPFEETMTPPAFNSFTWGFGSQSRISSISTVDTSDEGRRYLQWSVVTCGLWGNPTDEGRLNGDTNMCLYVFPFYRYVVKPRRPFWRW